MTVYLGIITLTGVISAPQNDEKGLCQFEVVCLHLPPYQKGGVRPVLLIIPLCPLRCHQESFRCNQPWIILICLDSSSQ